MTKLNPEDTIIHVIGNNVTGNKKGEKLMKFLSKSMKPSVVKVESPLELSPTGILFILDQLKKTSHYHQD